MRTFPNVSGCIQTYPEMSLHIQKCPNISKHILTFPNVSGHIQTYSMWTRLTRPKTTPEKKYFCQINILWFRVSFSPWQWSPCHNPLLASFLDWFECPGSFGASPWDHCWCNQITFHSLWWLDCCWHFLQRGVIFENPETMLAYCQEYLKMTLVQDFSSITSKNRQHFHRLVSFLSSSHNFCHRRSTLLNSSCCSTLKSSHSRIRSFDEHC